MAKQICPNCKANPVPVENSQRNGDMLCQKCGMCISTVRPQEPYSVPRGLGYLLQKIKKSLALRKFRKHNIRVGKGVGVSPGFRYLWGNVDVGDYVTLNNTYIDDSATVTIGDYCFFGPDCMIITSSHDYRYKDDERRRSLYYRSVKIGRGVWVASRCIITGGVTIGDYAVIGAGSVVTKDIPPGVLAAGIPAVPVKEIWPKDSSLDTDSPC